MYNAPYLHAVKDVMSKLREKVVDAENITPEEVGEIEEEEVTEEPIDLGELTFRALMD